ncbi:hypothetical protein [Enterococcus sp.]|uniref:hypothetical protein n=1 Tax=Enterococcus sp. TaxID=35783 RepID=UPI000EC8F054|nr:hypothetical protein [Enterococcus sp.]HCM87347.1 hypothetical protein [Enterococcus sp.]
MKYVYRIREKGFMTLTEKNKLHSMPTANRLREVFLKTIKRAASYRSNWQNEKDFWVEYTIIDGT